MVIPVDSGKDYLTWGFDFALSTFYEVETSLVEPLLPPRLTAMEAAPGVSLIMVTCFNFAEGSLGTLPEFQELIFGVVVSPDLSRGVPKFATYVVSLASSSQEHLDHSKEYYKLPIFGQLSKVGISREELAVEYEDSRGEILTMNNCVPNPAYKKGESYFQVYTSEDSSIYVGDVYVKARMFEHQEPGDVGKLFNHPFFGDLDIEEADPTVYLQIINEPRKIGEQYYFKPEKYA
ncbi:MAG: hypothetical protein V3U24_06710 [Candidatus Neomarinimicrobiota bacterium]